MLALVCSGRPVQTAPVQVASNKFIFEVPPGVCHLAVFFTQPPPSDYGAAIYYASGEDWQFLGSLTGDKPSAIYKLSANTNNLEGGKLGIDIEPLQSLASLMSTSLVPSHANNHSVQLTAEKVLTNLYNYIMSFTNNPNNPMQAIPIRLFNEWHNGIMKRLQGDPNFLK